MAHKKTDATSKKVLKMLVDGKPDIAVAKSLKISRNTFKKIYAEEMEEAEKKCKDKSISNLVTLSKAHGANNENISKAVGVSTPTLGKRYQLELHEGYTAMGKAAINCLLNRVKNGIEETHIAYEVTAWDEKGNPTEQKIIAYGKKTKSCTTRDVNLLINLTTNGISHKDQEAIKIAKERFQIIDEVKEEKPETIDYSKLSLEDLKEMKRIMEKAKRGEEK